MTQRVFVKVIGFSDVERHALNTVFRLSEERGTVFYSLWVDDAPEPPKLALVDGQGLQDRSEVQSTAGAGLRLIWVGSAPPENTWRSFERPLSWPDVIKAMDELFAPPEALDFDLGWDSGVADTRPPDRRNAKRALIASPDHQERLYLRARLALADLTQADEAETGAQALELTRAHHYAVALVDFSLPDVDGWAFVRELTGATPAIGHIILTKSNASLGAQLRARMAGAKACLGKPPHPARLRELLEKV
jgi:CheY-like chemotaxis protein